MRLIFVTPMHRLMGGVLRSATRMASAMTARGHAVCTVTPSASLFPGDRRWRGATMLFGATEPSDPQRWIGPIQDAATQFRADLLIGYYGSSGGYAVVEVAKQLGLPGVLCLRGNDVDRDLAHSVRGQRVRSAVRDASAVTAVSREMVARVDEVLGRRPAFVSNSVDRDEFFPDPAAAVQFRAAVGLGGGPVVGIFGELKPKRGLERLAAVGPELGRWQVVVVGRVRADSRHLICPSWHRVDPLHAVPALRGAYTACDVVVQPSLRDGMPNVVLEAMACETTVVASRVGGIVDAIDDGRTGILIDDAAGLSRALNSLRRRPRPELGVAARRSAPRVADECTAFERVFAAAQQLHGQQRAF